jgi:hypothetical protein
MVKKWGPAKEPINVFWVSKYLGEFISEGVWKHMMAMHRY